MENSNKKMESPCVLLATTKDRRIITLLIKDFVPDVVKKWMPRMELKQWVCHGILNVLIAKNVEKTFQMEVTQNLKKDLIVLVVYLRIQIIVMDATNHYLVKLQMLLERIGMLVALNASDVRKV
jgi:hypothetical protein